MSLNKKKVVKTWPDKIFKTICQTLNEKKKKKTLSVNDNKEIYQRPIVF